MQKFTVVSTLDVDALPVPVYFVEHMEGEDLEDLLFQFTIGELLDRSIIAVFEGHLEDLTEYRA